MMRLLHVSALTDLSHGGYSQTNTL